MSNVDYKKKYLELRSVLNNVIDQSFRMGYQQGFKDAQMEAMAQQAQMQQDMMARLTGGMDGDPNQPDIVDDGSGIPAEDQANIVMDNAADTQAEEASTELELGMA